jgi:hypothetical protein
VNEVEQILRALALGGEVIVRIVKTDFLVQLQYCPEVNGRGPTFLDAARDCACQIFSLNDKHLSYVPHFVLDALDAVDYYSTLCPESYRLNSGCISIEEIRRYERKHV